MAIPLCIAESTNVPNDVQSNFKNHLLCMIRDQFPNTKSTTNEVNWKKNPLCMQVQRLLSKILNKF